jgi:hypothetical protein
MEIIGGLTTAVRILSFARVQVNAIVERVRGSANVSRRMVHPLATVFPLVELFMPAMGPLARLILMLT